MKKIYKEYKTLQVIGDITCDPNGSIEFSKETWIDDPVYIYNPETETITDGFEGEGIAVMAVTNLPCEFSADASIQFGGNLAPFYKNIVSADYKKYQKLFYASTSFNSGIKTKKFIDDYTKHASKIGLPFAVNLLKKNRD